VLLQFIFHFFTILFSLKPCYYTLCVYVAVFHLKQSIVKVFVILHQSQWVDAVRRYVETRESCPLAADVSPNRFLCSSILGDSKFVDLLEIKTHL